MPVFVNDAGTRQSSRALSRAGSTSANAPRPTNDLPSIPACRLFIVPVLKNEFRQRGTTTRPDQLASFATSSFLGPTSKETVEPPFKKAVASDREVVIENSQYQELIAKEAKHWSEVRPDPQNPQIWHDPQLFQIFFGKHYRHLIERAVASGPNVLELGCGEGNLSIELAQRGLRVTAYDLSPERIERAQARARQFSLDDRTTFYVGDLNTIALPAEAFDSVVAHDTLHHILNIDRLCNEVRGCLKPTGVFIVMDFIGMGAIRKILAAVLYAVVPTYQPYRVKWTLRRRLRGFLSSETQRRQSLEDGSPSSLHGESPFEEISQRSIVEEIKRRFLVTAYVTYSPFWFYFAAKIRLPKAMKYSVARLFQAMDDWILRLGLARGAYFFLEATRR